MIRILYRTCARENQKQRPGWYSKARCLASLMDARRQLPRTAFTIVSDGPPPPEVLGGTDRERDVTVLPGVGNAESFLIAFSIAASWPSDDVVYFVEDDYLHTPDALSKLEEAVGEVPFDYITLYDHPDRYLPTNHPRHDLPLLTDALYTSRSHQWRTVESTCMTFAARVRTLREDFDAFMTYVIPKRIPYDRGLFRHLQGLGSSRPETHRRLLVGALPSLATHCEAAYLAPGVDWDAMAQLVARG
jgi:hypothetical protein